MDWREIICVCLRRLVLEAAGATAIKSRADLCRHCWSETVCV